MSAGWLTFWSRLAVQVQWLSEDTQPYFQEVGTRAVPGAYAAPPSREAIQRFLKVSERYGYWNATPEENARVGLSVP